MGDINPRKGVDVRSPEVSPGLRSGFRAEGLTKVAAGFNTYSRFREDSIQQTTVHKVPKISWLIK